MQRFCVVLALVVGLSATLHATDPELAGNWIGAVDTPKGQMDIGLNLKVEKGKLIGELKTGHGDWEITDVSEKDGYWTVSFTSPGGPGKLSGRVKEQRFTGDWKSPMAEGTFELSRSKKKTLSRAAGSHLTERVVQDLQDAVGLLR